MTHIDVKVLKVKDIRGRKIVGYRAEYGYFATETRATPELAIAALDKELSFRSQPDNLQPTIQCFGGHTLVVWYNGYSWSYVITELRGSTSGLVDRKTAIAAGHDHLAQIMMDEKQGREQAREVAADKSLFDSLFPVAA